MIFHAVPTRASMNASTPQCEKVCVPVEREVRPYLRDGPVDAHLRVIDALVPYIAGRSARDRCAELTGRRERDGGCAARRDADEPRRRIERLREERRVAGAHCVEHLLHGREDGRAVGGADPGRPRRVLRR